MAEGEFHVVFHGELTGELPHETVKDNLAGLFRLSEERAEALFSGKPVVVKRGIDEATARKFESAFRKAGAVCEIRREGDAPATDTPAHATGAPGAAAPRERAGESGARADEPGSAIAAAGDPHGTVLAISVPADLGPLALDESEAPLQPPARAASPEIDISGLELATDDRPLTERSRGEPPEIDTSSLSLEPPR